MTKFVALVMALMLLLAMTTPVVAQTPTDTEVILVPDDYSTIQEAIDAADPGKLTSIIVDPVGDPYDDPIIIRTSDAYIDLIGNNTQIYGNGADAIALQPGVHHISISGFDITTTGNKHGITDWTNLEQQPIHDICIHQNKIHGNLNGINLGRWGAILAYNITIQHNEIFNNEHGINLYWDKEVTIAHNEISRNDQGIWWINIDDSIATHNNIHETDVGLWLAQGCSGNEIVHNQVSNNGQYGIILTSVVGQETTGNTITHNDFRHNGVLDIYEVGVVTGNNWVKNLYVYASPDPPQ